MVEGEGMGPAWCQPAVCRDAQIESLKREVDTLRAEMEKIKLEVRLGTML